MKFSNEKLKHYEKEYREIVQKVIRDPTYSIDKFSRDMECLKAPFRGLNTTSKRFFEISNRVLAEVVAEVNEELDELARHVEKPEKIDPQEWTTLNVRMSCLKNGLLHTEVIREINHHFWIMGYWSYFDFLKKYYI